MKLIGVDTETHLIRQGMLDPPVVCVAFSDMQEPLLRDEGIDRLLSLLEAGQGIVLHNAAFDVACVVRHRPDKHRFLWDCISNGQIRCTMVREKLTQIKEGFLTRAGLDFVAKKYVGVNLDKKDYWRTRFSELDNVPVAEWPAEARNYVMGDVRWLPVIYSMQHNSPDEIAQTQAAYVLHRMAMWGICTDGDRVKRLEAAVTAERDAAFKDVLAGGLFRKQVKRGSSLVTYHKNMKAIRDAIVAEFGPNSKLTETGLIATGADVVKDAKHPGLRALTQYSNSEKMLSTYIEKMKLGSALPINSRPNVLVMTGRTSWGEPNLQNQPRRAGFRECFVPREGMVFADADYSTLEVRTLGQSIKDLFGYSKIVDIYRSDPDIDIYNSFSATTGYSRTHSKVAMLALPGGLGIATLVEFSRTMFGMNLSETEARMLKSAWLTQFPEMRRFFDYVSQVVESVGEIVLPRSGRLRGGVGFCDACNYFFQGPASDGGKAALVAVWEQCVFGSGPLRGSHPTVFVHDEILLESPEEGAQEALQSMMQIMEEKMQEVATPDVEHRTAGWVADCWVKQDGVRLKDIRKDGIAIKRTKSS